MLLRLPAEETLIRRGKWTYICALLLIAALNLGDHLITDSIIHREVDTARIVNLSGRQRMLSQRIVQFALERALHRVPQGDFAAQSNLRDAVDQMSTVHNSLLNGSAKLHLAPPPASVRDIYTGPRWNLDAQFQQFLLHARALADEPTTKLSLNDSDLIEIEEEASDSLLNALDAAVIANQEHSERAIGQLRTVLALLTILMLVVLLAEALLLFRPLFQRLNYQQQRLNDIGRTDPLTGCFNRRAFEEFATAAIDRARRTAEPLSLFSIDLDHFKTVNDTHGHAAGDLVLQTFVTTIAQHIRISDLLFRVGGEEFMLLLPAATEESLACVANRFREAVERASITVCTTELHITVSLGAATLDPADTTLHDLILRADLALYKAKRGGRNRVELASQPAVTLPPHVVLSLTPSPEPLQVANQPS